ncbi:sarcosine dehydrogenase, mitochondrial-like [Oppia nitens]|uniref:sarcosine dehydrogenase, mitochondrial-like n=1 Tax=Oppia nitens TaxID=1686743 RepID=UPI0023DC18FC|nr:sarcosine dehydrogenase, mitochondrial-like [Oppia nitens]
MYRQFARFYSTSINTRSATKVLPKSCDVVVVGGGVIGLSTVYHLSELGYNNVILVERDEITSGTTWHSNGLVWRLRPSETDIKLLTQTHHLVSKKLLTHPGVETTGFINNGGLFLAHSDQRMQEYQRLHGIAKYYGIESYLLDKRQTIDLLSPLIDEKNSDLAGGLYSPNDGYVDPYMYCSALTKAANINIFTKCPVIGINTTESQGISVRQSKVNAITVDYNNSLHEIKTNVIVNCSGVWAPVVAKLAGIPSIPQETMEHSYVITQPIDGVKPDRTPNIRDHDLSIALRVSGQSFCIGGYEPDPVLISHRNDKLDPFTLFDLNWDKFGINLENSAKLMPVIGSTGIKATTCGPESFTPDHRPLLGEDLNVRGFFHCSAFNSFGISLSGGIGQQMAKWIVTGAPDIDLTAYDIKRFNKHLVSNKVWSNERCVEAYARNYGIIYPFDEPFTARTETYTDSLHEILLSNGCVYRERHGIHCPDWFDLERHSPLTYEQYMDLDNTYDWPEECRQWKAIKYECKACHEEAVLFNLTSKAKFSLIGVNAMKVINKLVPNDVQSVPNNHTFVTYLLNKRGGIMAEMIVNKIDDNSYYITAADMPSNQVYAAFCNVIIVDSVKDTEFIDMSQEMAILSLNGPKSTEVLQQCFNISLNDFNDRTHREIMFDDIIIRLVRFSQVSHTGWELHVKNNSDLIKIYTRLTTNKIVVNGGYRAYESLKNENQWLSGCLDLRSDDFLSDAGLQTCINERKQQLKHFIGSDLNRDVDETKRFVWIKPLNNKVMVCGLEPIWFKSRPIGFVRRNFYSHKNQQMLAFGIIYDKHIKDINGLPLEVDIEIFGQMNRAIIEQVFCKQ